MDKESNFMMIHFLYNEFSCPCCHKNIMQDPFLARLDAARTLAGVPFVITSGYRCVRHNIVIGGSKTSAHLDGWAADIAAEDPRTRERIIYGLIMAGFNRIGIKENMIHVDSHPDKPSNVIWSYK